MPAMSTLNIVPNYASVSKFQAALKENALAIQSYQTDLGHLALVISSTTSFLKQTATPLSKNPPIQVSHLQIPPKAYQPEHLPKMTWRFFHTPRRQPFIRSTSPNRSTSSLEQPRQLYVISSWTQLTKNTSKYLRVQGQDIHKWTHYSWWLPFDRHM